MHSYLPADITNDATHLFDDVVEEFCTIGPILHRFAAWRERVPGSYAQAYIAMCLPQLLAPLVRLQMLTWNPIEVGFGVYFSYFTDVLAVSQVEMLPSHISSRPFFHKVVLKRS